MSAIDALFGRNALFPDLSAPDAEAVAHTEALAAVIRTAIEHAGGAIPFVEYMNTALYEPQLGYYTSAIGTFGEAADFVTAPEISPLFARCVAHQCAEISDNPDIDTVLEVGAGSGRLAAGVLRELATLNVPIKRYQILEVSPNLRRQQAQTLRAETPDLLDRVEWLDRLPEPGFNGVIIANELLDAMPVHRVRRRDGAVYELYTACDEVGFVDVERILSNGQLLDRAERLLPDSDFYESEINLRAEAWVSSVAKLLNKGLILLIDYGFGRREYYHPERKAGTLMCHYRHRAHPNPYVLPGLQDVTAHVDFTAMAQAAFDGGLDVLGFQTQANFLIDLGLLDMLAEFDPNDVDIYLPLASAVKKLLLPGEMGELFKVMALGKGIEEPLLGFRSSDLRFQL